MLTEVFTVLEHSKIKNSDVATNLRAREARVFLFLTVVLAPALAVAIVGCYGLAIWIYQMWAGPPVGG